MIRAMIKLELTDRNISIRQMCKKLNIREASVSEFLSGKRKNIGIPKLEKILKFLDISLTRDIVRD